MDTDGGCTPLVMTCHGVLVAVAGAGVLLTGPSGLGKSALALELVSRGHRLIADDSVEISRSGNTLEGCCPVADFSPFLAVRGLGVLNIHRLYGAAAVGSRQRLDLLIQLIAPAELDALLADEATARLSGLRRCRELLGITLPELLLPVWPERPLAVMIECAGRDAALRATGYHADQDFAARLQTRLASMSPCE